MNNEGSLFIPVLKTALPVSPLFNKIYIYWILSYTYIICIMLNYILH